MDTTRICKLCRQPLAENDPEEICWQCLTKAEVAELAPHFPQLEILHLLGKGGMGMVYKARQPNLNRIVALKILAPELSGDPAFAERFSREARALAKLNHPGIVQVYDFGRTGPYYYFIMEYVDGMNLRQLLGQQTVTPRQTLELVVQICTALQYAHDEGVVHRDIKPENILLNNKGQVKIADFGIAKLRGSAPDTTLTTTGAAMGTLNYMAPEQREHAQGVDHRADIYSLGVVFYEMLTGEVPMGRFEPPSKKVQVDVRLDEVVLRALEREPARRYQKASEVKTGVEAITDIPAAVTGRMARPPFNRPGRLPFYLFGVAALLALAVWLRPFAPDSLDILIKPGPARLVERASQQLERYDRPGHIDRAMRDLEEAKRQDPSYADAHAWLGLAYWRRYKQNKDVKDRSDAGRCSSNALALNPDSGTALFVQGLVAEDEKRPGAATNFLCLANDRFKWEDGEVLIHLAAVYWSLTNSPQALNYAQKANAVRNKPWYFYNGMGFFEFNLNDLEAAQSNFEVATQIADDSPMAWLNLGKVLVYQTSRNENDYAHKCFTKSLSLYPTDAAYEGLGDLYFSTSNWLDAANNFREAADLNPARYDFPGKEGLALIELPGANYRDQARAELNKAVDKVQSLLKETRDPVTESRLGLYQAGLGQATNAYETLQAALQSSPDDQQIKYNIEDAADCLKNIYHLPSEAGHIRQLLQEKIGNQ